MNKTFVLKTAHGKTTVGWEIEILKKIRDANCDCKHLPELVWEPGGEREFGILPVGEPINFKEPRKVSRKIVEGLMNGLRWLHSHNIIHRDIRPSNLVIDGLDNLVIIDYETAVVRVEGEEVEYMGGFLCWPKRLIESNRTWYVPEPEDDLFASILAVSQMVFPTKFEGFRVSSIGVSGDGEKRSPETERLLNLWKDIEVSEQWGPFAVAARECNYEKLKRMGDMFWHI
jgi:serine/threonine protein kinase